MRHHAFHPSVDLLSAPVLSHPRPVSRVRFIARHRPWLPGAAWPGRHEATRNPETGTIRGEYYEHLVSTQCQPCQHRSCQKSFSSIYKVFLVNLSPRHYSPLEQARAKRLVTCKGRRDWPRPTDPVFTFFTSLWAETLRSSQSGKCSSGRARTINTLCHASLIQTLNPGSVLRSHWLLVKWLKHKTRLNWSWKLRGNRQTLSVFLESLKSILLCILTDCDHWLAAVKEGPSLLRDQASGCSPAYCSQRQRRPDCRSESKFCSHSTIKLCTDNMKPFATLQWPLISSNKSCLIV